MTSTQKSFLRHLNLTGRGENTLFPILESNDTASLENIWSDEAIAALGNDTSEDESDAGEWIAKAIALRHQVTEEMKAA